LSKKGTPYDNTVAEAMFITIKTEFIHGTVFPYQQALYLELFDYVSWFNNIRIHRSLNYLTPTELMPEKKHEQDEDALSLLRSL